MVRCSKIRILSNNFVVIPKMNIFSIEIRPRRLYAKKMMIPYRIWNTRTHQHRNRGLVIYGGVKGLENGKNVGFKHRMYTTLWGFYFRSCVSLLLFSANARIFVHFWCTSVTLTLSTTMGIALSTRGCLVGGNKKITSPFSVEI